MAHTPGPWKDNYREDTGFNDDGAIIREENPDEIIVTDIYGTTHQERLDNASLIATAPELLIHHEDFMVEYCTLCKRLNPQHENCDSCDYMEEKRRILRKAKGGKP